MIDAVLSYHLNGDTCGVAKFNQQLAQKLGVPCYGLGPAASRHPLISFKPSEVTGVNWFALKQFYRTYDVFLHDSPRGEWQTWLVLHAQRVYLGNPTIQTDRPDAIVTGCPSTLQGNASRPGLTVLAFGMAHKFNRPHFERLHTLLEGSGRPYTVCISSAMHEGSPWDTTTRELVAALRSLFGSHLRWLGFLADDALAREIREAHTVALFYDPAVRANNTTLWAALEAGTPVITNLDAQSPPELVHHVSVFDIAQLDEWPEYDGRRQEMRAGGVKAAQAYAWDTLLAQLSVVHA